MLRRIRRSDLLDMMDHAMVSWVYWTPRVILTVVMIVLIKRDTMEANDLIMNLPAEYVPMVFVVTILAGLLITFARGFFKFSEEFKNQARTTGIRIAYGLDYLSKNIVVAILSGALAIVALGVFYSMTDVAPTQDACMAIGFGVAMVIAWGGESLANLILESIRNFSKGKDALEIQKSEETEEKKN